MVEATPNAWEGQRFRRHPLDVPLQVLNAMVDGPDRAWGIRELARHLDVPPSTVHRACQELLRSALIERAENRGTYSLGLEFFRLMLRSSIDLPSRRVATPFLTECATESNETVCLGLYSPQHHELMFVSSVEARSPVRYVVELYTWLPLHAGASGLAILAYLSDEAVQTVVAQTGLAPLTERTIVDANSLGRELASIRRRGYAFSRGQRTRGAVGVAAPILDRHGVPIGDVLITIPEQRFAGHMERRFANAAMKCADNIAASLNRSGRPDPPALESARAGR